MKYVLILRTCSADMTSTNGFKWPKKGAVKCADWKPTAECGNGLHGLLWGEGDGGLLNWAEDAKWLVVRVLARSVVAIGADKVKFPAGTVVHCGDRKSATEYIQKRGGAGKRVAGAVSTAGDRGTATAGYWGTATAGYWGTATAGDRGTATAGYWGVITITWWDGEQYRRAIGEIDGKVLLPGKKYRVKNGKFVEAE